MCSCVSVWEKRERESYLSPVGHLGSEWGSSESISCNFPDYDLCEPRSQEKNALSWFALTATTLQKYLFMDRENNFEKIKVIVQKYQRKKKLGLNSYITITYQDFAM